MKTKLALSAVVAAIAVFSQGAFAQASAPGAPQTRSEVKAGAQAKTVAPAGERPTAAPPKTSDTTRAARKEQTKADEKAGKIKEAGEASGMKDEKVNKGSDTTRDARKEKTKAEQKAGQIPEAGEAGSPKGPSPTPAKKP